MVGSDRCVQGSEKLALLICSAQVWLLMDGSSPISKVKEYQPPTPIPTSNSHPDPRPISKVKELEELEVKRVLRVTSGFEPVDPSATPLHLRTVAEWARAMGSSLAPVALDRITIAVALETGCNAVVCPGEADELVAELANCLQGAALSEDNAQH